MGGDAEGQVKYYLEHTELYCVYFEVCERIRCTAWDKTTAATNSNHSSSRSFWASRSQIHNWTKSITGGGVSVSAPSNWCSSRSSWGFPGCWIRKYVSHCYWNLTFIWRHFLVTQLIALHAHRITIMTKDMWLLQELRRRITGEDVSWC